MAALLWKLWVVIVLVLMVLRPVFVGNYASVSEGSKSLVVATELVNVPFPIDGISDGIKSLPVKELVSGKENLPLPIARIPERSKSLAVVDELVNVKEYLPFPITGFPEGSKSLAVVEDNLPFSIGGRKLHSLPSRRDDRFLLALPDGNITYLDESGNIYWSFCSGGTCEYSEGLAEQNEPEKSFDGDGFSMFGGDDGHLYVLMKEEKKLLGISPGEYAMSTPHIYNGRVTHGVKTITSYYVDAETGEILHKIQMTPSKADLRSPETLSLEDYFGTTPGHECVFITRTDYTFNSHTLHSGKLLWTTSVAEFDAAICNSSTSYCEHVTVRRKFNITDFKLIDEKRKQLDALPSASSESEGHQRADHKIPSTLRDALPGASSESEGHQRADHKIPSTLRLLLGFSSLVIVALIALFLLVLLRLKIGRVQNTSVENRPPQSVASKKRKPKKSGGNKIHVVAESQNDSSTDGNILLNGHANGRYANGDSGISSIKGNDVGGRTIGKLFVSTTEIAKGSNGTVVFLGRYGGRVAAVKRLVRAHSGIASKEVETLLESDNHSNIVRWYGVEYDEDFVYLSLERCSCSLGDLIEWKSRLSPDVTPISTAISNSIEGIEDVVLWKASGYPSSELLGLMRGIVAGLAHLHDLKIIHRDLKPQNVLISAVTGRPLCAKLSDMGISKKLSAGKLSLTNNGTGLGSSGWQAPEVLHGHSHSFAVDLFSLGCVLFFCITKGRHPYGSYLERDSNIINDRLDLTSVSYIPEAVHLFSGLLHSNPCVRPTASEVLHHPLFWTSEMRLSFLRDSSDRIELEDREKKSSLVDEIENVGSLIFGGNWEDKFDDMFLSNIGNHRRYNFSSTRHLLRLLRNKWNHYIEFPKEVQEYLGKMPEGFDEYVTSRFPKLLIMIYEVMLATCKGEEYFVKYFGRS